jgi:hypothetical protein
VLVGSHGLGRIHHLLDGGHRRITILVAASMAMNPVRHVRLDLQDIGSPVWTRTLRWLVKARPAGPLPLTPRR